MKTNHNDEKSNLVKSMIETIKRFAENTDIQKIIINNSEAVWDTFMYQTELLKRIPIIGTISSVAQAGITIRDRFFIKKLIRFLQGFNDIDEELDQKLKKALADPTSAEKLGENLVIALDRFEQLTKAEALCKIFLAHCNDEISYEEFLDYIYVLDKINYSSIPCLREFYSPNIGENHEERYELSSLLTVGLVSIDLGNLLTQKSWYSEHSQGIRFTRNAMGEKFLRVLGFL